MKTSSMQILLIEDDPSHVAYLRELLGPALPRPVALTVCPTLAEAQAALAEHPFEVILLDLFLPDSQGLATLQEVRTGAARTPILVLTGHDDTNLGLEAARQGAQDYLVKGRVDLQTLGRAICYAIERHRIEETLREREEFFRLISENMTDLVAVVDRDGKRLYNSASYRGLLEDPGHTHGADSFAEVHPEDKERVRRVFRKTVSSGVGQRAEYRFVTPTGAVRYIESQSSVIKDARGQTAQVVVVSRDITERKQAELVLRESEQRYRRLLASTTDYIYTVKVKDGKAVASTHGPGCAAVTGYDPSDYEADQHLWYQMVHEADREKVVDQARRVLAGETVPPLEHRLWHKDGSLRWVRNTPVPQKDKQGRLVGYDGLITNITERKRAELALAEERNLLRTLIDSLPDQIYVLDQDDRYLLDNVAHRQFLGATTAQEVLGKTLLDFFPKELVAGLVQDDHEVFRSGQPLLNREEPIVQRDGSRRWVQTTKVPLRDAWGQLAGMVGISRDITEQRRAHEERERFFTISPDMLCVAGFDGYFKQLNPAWAKVLGYRDEDLLAEPYMNFVHPEDQEKTMAEGRKLLAGQWTFGFENRYRCRDGSYRWLQWSACPLEEQRLIYAAARDITDWKRSEAELKQAYAELARSEETLRRTLEELRRSHEQLKEAQLQLIQFEKMESVGALAAGVAHEVKNPLQTILMGVDYLGNTAAKTDQSLAPVLNDMRDAIGRADAIVKGLLEFSAAHQLTLEDADLNTLVEHSLRLANYGFMNRPVTVVRELSPLLPRVRLDRNKMSQVLINLFLNAVQAMPEGGVIGIKTYVTTLTAPVAQWGDRPAAGFSEGQRVVILEITDSGVGIPQDRAMRIFDPFFTTKPPGTGTGLGLTVVQKIIELHRGLISIRNRPEGGVKATITLRTEHDKHDGKAANPDH